jgi:ubiquinone/menaquinone biosynthesis C-methylase UbiE
LLPIPVVLIAFNLIDGAISGKPWPFAAALIVTACALCGLYASRRGKFAVWAELLDQLALKGDEHILDMGCGRGAVLLMAAGHLKTGKAVGVDLWRREDQSGNSADATWRNAAAEGVTDRIEVRTADMTALPFDENAFDLIVSNLAIHNIKGKAGRNRAIDEAARVLRPGGRLMIADIWATGQYCTRLAELGMIDIARRGLGWRMWWTGPWAATRLVTATKPASRATRLLPG